MRDIIAFLLSSSPTFSSRSPSPHASGAGPIASFLCLPPSHQTFQFFSLLIRHVYIGRIPLPPKNLPSLPRSLFSPFSLVLSSPFQGISFPMYTDLTKFYPRVPKSCRKHDRPIRCRSRNGSNPAEPSFSISRTGIREEGHGGREGGREGGRVEGLRYKQPCHASEE